MLRTSSLVFGILLLAFSCSQSPEKGSKQLVLKFDDSVNVGYNIPVFIDDSKYTYLAKENFMNHHVELFLPETINLEKLNSFELRRMDLFGSVGLYIDHTDLGKNYKSEDTVQVISDLNYADVSSSDLDTADVINIINAFQEVGKKFNGD